MHGRTRALVACLVFAAACDDTNVTVIDGPGVFEPATLDFGTRTLGITHELVTTLAVPTSADTLQVLDVRFDPPTDAFAARTAEGGVLRGAVLTRGTRVDVRVLFAPRTAGRYEGSMLVAFQDDRAARLGLVASGTADASQDVVLVPASLDFGPIELGRDAVRTISIGNEGLAPASIRDVRLRSNGLLTGSGSTPIFATRRGSTDRLDGSSIAAGATIEADVHFLPTTQGAFEDGLLFVLDSVASVTLPITGRGVTAGALRCTPFSVDFGALIRGNAAEESISCSVIEGTYTIGDLRLGLGSSAVFSVTSAPSAGTRLEAGDAFAITVRFSAQGLPLLHTGDLVIGSQLGQQTLIGLRAKVDPPALADRDLSVVARWDTAGTDVDLHLVRAGGAPFDPLNDCYFQRKHPDWGTTGDPEDDPYLDRDDTDGFGPEEVNLATARELRYDVYAHYYRAEAGVVSTVEISVHLSGRLAQAQIRPLSSCGTLWHVGTIHFTGASPRFELVDATSDATARASCP